jgi:hypothetical protein
LEKLLLATRTLIRGRRCSKRRLAEGLIDDARELLEELETDLVSTPDEICSFMAVENCTL